MAFILEAENNLKQAKNSKMKERGQSPQAKLSIKHQDKSRAKNHVDCGLVEPKSSGNHGRAVKGKAKKSDELVKYMSDVPGYLQRVETGESCKGKVLNVGVLDWSSLEKFSHSQDMTIPLGGCMNASSSTSNSPRKTAIGSFSLPETDHCKSPRVQRMKPSTRQGTRFKDLGNSLDGNSKGKGLDQKISSETGNASTSMRDQGLPYKVERNIIRTPDGKARIKRSNLDGVSSDLEAFPSKLRNNESAKKADMKMRVLEYKESAIDLGKPDCPDEPKNIVLILPKKYYQNSVSENTTLTDGDSKGADKSKFLGTFPSMEVSPSGVPHSCPLPVPSRVETTSEPDMLPLHQINVQSTELRSGVNERAERELRSYTPNRRFSFSLGKMGRSSSLKEGGPGFPQLSSTTLIAKSGPVEEEKRNLHSRARSSPLRRLLDPFLKHKSETVRPPPKGNLNSPSFSSTNTSESTSELPLNEKPAASATVQAFLQLTVKNGLPLFRFVADNNGHVLAATVRNFTSPEKDDSSENFTFYSVNEVKKKSAGGWMNQGSKEKKCEYAYNVVGQMKVSSRHSSSTQFVIKESILSGLEQDSTESTIHRELAAVVVEIPKKGSKEWFPEHIDSASTVAILPGGLHSFPEKGAPSTLIDRWRSGGSCDCGGWDMGCKLRILSSYDPSATFSRAVSVTCPIQDRFELFVQEGTQQDRPIFSLAPIKNGVYSIAFSASISLLQAFFISVAVLHPQKFPDHLKDFQELVSNEPDHSPARFASNPPLSPVGRV